MNRLLKPRPRNTTDSRLQNGKIGSILHVGMILMNSSTASKKKKSTISYEIRWHEKMWVIKEAHFSCKGGLKSTKCLRDETALRVLSGL